MDGDNSSKGRNRLSDMAPTPQGTEREEEEFKNLSVANNLFLQFDHSYTCFSCT